VFCAYVHQYGTKGAFERLNNRSIASILAEHDSMEFPTPSASGEKDGVSWALYEPPSDK
jgi:hypothetical protein